MHDVGAQSEKRVTKLDHVERSRHAGRESQHRHRHPGRGNLPANGPRLVDADNSRLEARRQVADQVQDHFFSAADHERVREINHTGTVCALEIAWAR